MKSVLMWSNSSALLSCTILGYFLFQETPLLGLLDILAVVLWVAADYLERNWMYHIAFGVNIFLITLSAIFETPLIWIIVSFGLIFIAYDLKSWGNRISEIKNDEHLSQVSKNHYLRFGWTLGIGLILSVIATQTDINASFGQIFFLGLLLFFSLNLSIGTVQKITKPPKKKYPLP